MFVPVSPALFVPRPVISMPSPSKRSVASTFSSRTGQLLAGGAARRPVVELGEEVVAAAPFHVRFDDEGALLPRFVLLEGKRVSSPLSFHRAARRVAPKMAPRR